MVVLEVGIDAQGAIRGGQQATAAFGRLADSAAFMLTAIGGANSAMGKLGAALSRAQPWLVAISAAMSAVSVGMQLMSRNTKEAAGEWDKLATAMARAKAGIQAAGILGTPAAQFMSEQAKTQIGALQQAFAQGGDTTFGSLAGATGMSNQQLLTLLRSEGHRSAIEYSRTGRFVSGQSQFFGPGGTSGVSNQYSTDISGLRITQSQVNDILRRTYGYYERSAFNQQMSESGFVPPEGSYPIGGQIGPPSPFQPASGEVYGPGQADWQGEQARRLQESQARMADIESMSRRIGDNLGDAAFDFVAGLRDGRDVMASILIDIGRSLSREAIGSLTKSIISSFG